MPNAASPGSPGSPRSSRRIDRHVAIPYYYQLKVILSEEITSGALAAGTQLPGEHELCAFYDVSRTVVRQALNELYYEGLVERRRGKGTFVARPKLPEGLMSDLAGLHADVTARGQTLDTRVLALRTVPAIAPVAERLGLGSGEAVVELERLRHVDGVPWVVVVTYLPAALVPGLEARDLGGDASLYRLLADEYGLPVTAALRTVEATVAGERDARLLDVDEGSPLLVLRSVTMTAGDRPFEYFVAHHRGDRSAFTVYLSGGNPGVPAAATAGLAAKR